MKQPQERVNDRVLGIVYFQIWFRISIHEMKTLPKLQRTRGMCAFNKVTSLRHLNI